MHIAKANLIVNNSRVFFYQNTDSDLNIPNDWEPKFDLIISNILAEPLIHMAKKFRSMSHSGTKIILSGFLDYQQNDVQDAYKAAGFVVEDILSRDRWIAMTLSVKSY